MKTNTNKPDIKKLTLRILALLACYELGGSKKRINTEDIIFQIFKWSPEQCSWTMPKYKKFPEKLVVVKRLFDLKEDHLVVGAMSVDLSKDGWTLTKKGLIHVQEYVESIPKKKRTKNNKSDSRNEELILLNVHQKLINIDIKNMDVLGLYNLLEVNSGNKAYLRTKFDHLHKLSYLHKNKVLNSLLDEILIKFNELLDAEKYSNQHSSYYRKERKLKNE